MYEVTPVKTAKDGFRCKNSAPWEICDWEEIRNITVESCNWRDLVGDNPSAETTYSYGLTLTLTLCNCGFVLPKLG